MKKLTLSEWAAAGEIVGTVAVVVSLLFVAYSVDRNTDATQASNENILFERHTDLANQFLLDPTLAEILLKKRNGAAGLSDVEGIRWEKYELGMLDIWALAHSRYDRNLLSEEQWVAWDRYFTHLFSKEAESITRGRWRELSYGYETGFWNHVGEALFGTAASAE
jgi:hypothetical protein